MGTGFYQDFLLTFNYFVPRKCSRKTSWQSDNRYITVSVACGRNVDVESPPFPCHRRGEIHTPESLPEKAWTDCCLCPVLLSYRITRLTSRTRWAHCGDETCQITTLAPDICQSRESEVTAASYFCLNRKLLSLNTPPQHPPTPPPQHHHA